ncbi:MAG: ATP-binding protein [Eubacteriaceae bacterium]|jgi:signal transduction histidine kinase/CheY-like chemotaxis protein|nr:ATP-binding protein [Eubacteriaceae bacterium]
MYENRRLKRIMALTLALCFCLFIAVFCILIRQYQNDNAYSSATHLIELNRQGGISVRTSLKEQRLTAVNIAHEIESGAYNEKTLPKALVYDKKIWNFNDFYIYTKNGRCINSTGRNKTDGKTSERAASAIRNGEAFFIVKSRLEYAASVDTDLEISGSRIVAVSAVLNLKDLLDRIDYKPFNGKGTTYLTRQNGVQICSSGSNAEDAYNVLSLFDTGTLQNLTGSNAGIGSTMEKSREGAFLYDPGSSGSSYIILTPIVFSGETLYLVTIEDQSLVNKSANDFSKYLVMLFVLIVLLFAVLAAIVVRIFNKRSRKYRADIDSRERLFDLLVSRTSNAFMLLIENEEKPVYITSNVRKILSDQAVKIRHENGVYQLAADNGKYDRTITLLNEELSKWDGRGEFTSGYVPYGPEGEGGYLKMSIYNAGTDSSSSKQEFIGIIQDASQEYKREQSLKDALDLADSANRAKSQFLSSISHDIRTPLNAIINTAKFLGNDLNDETKALEEIDVIQNSSLHLLGLINDVLDLSRIESGKITFTNDYFDMKAEIDKVHGIIGKLCESKQQTFSVELNDVRHNALIGDPVRLNQILINLLNNAMKFTPENGKIKFEITELDSISDKNIPFRFVISDNGIGIADGMIDKIFDPFARSSSQTVAKTEGSGLGLAITKSFVEALGGSIKVQSREGEGTAFTVELSYRADSSGRNDHTVMSHAEKNAQSFAGMRALLAEDNAVNRSIAITILSSWGMEIEWAENGRDALQMYLDNEPGYYDIIYLDIRMPELDGYETAEAIRASAAEDAATIPLIAMTANAFAEDIEKARLAGMNRHISKPIDVDTLFEVTMQFAGK